MAAAAWVMEATLDYVLHKYGTVERYLVTAGLAEDEIDAIRRNLRPFPAC